MRLYGFWVSSCTWRVRIALAYKQIEHEYVVVDLFGAKANQSPEYHARNPLEQVPLLEVERDGVVRRVPQSVAIIELLDELYPEPPLLPRDPFERARARHLAEMVNSGIQPLQNVGVQRHVKSIGGDPLEWARHWVGRGLRALEEEASGSATRFLMGSAPSLPDLFLAPQLYHARRFGLDLASLPTLLRVEEACNELSAFQVAHAEKQPDTPPEMRK